MAKMKKFMHQSKRTIRTKSGGIKVVQVKSHLQKYSFRVPKLKK